MKERRELLLFIPILLFLLSACGEPTLFPGTGSVSFYGSPTPEFQKPTAVMTQELTPRQIRSVIDIIRSVSEWNDDHSVNRAPFVFDGELQLYDTTYYFSYENGILYYNHFFGRITPEQADRIRKLEV